MSDAVGLKDVAALSSVSISTASRALSGSPRVSARTRARVERAASQLGYQANIAARGLRTKQSDLVGLVVPFLDSPTFTRLASEIQGKLRQAGFEVLLSVTDSDEEKTRTSLDILQSHQAAGAIVVSSQMHEPIDADRWRMPLVFLFKDPKSVNADSIRAADFDEIGEATEYLIDLGHRRIGLISGPTDVMVDAYALAHRRRGLDYDEALVHIDRYSPATGVAGVDRLLSLADRPTALLLCTYQIWKGALPRLHEHRVSIPEDISVICREESDVLEWWRPAMTTIPLDIVGIADLAAERLLYRMQDAAGRGEPGGRYSVRSRLVVRDSCAPPPPAVDAG